MIQLTDAQRERLNTLLCGDDAGRTEGLSNLGSLRVLIRLKLGWHSENAANTREGFCVVFDALREIEARGELETFLWAVRDARPNRQDLQEFCGQFRSSPRRRRPKPWSTSPPGGWPTCPNGWPTRRCARQRGSSRRTVITTGITSPGDAGAPVLTTDRKLIGPVVARLGPDESIVIPVKDMLSEYSLRLLSEPGLVSHFQPARKAAGRR